MAEYDADIEEAPPPAAAQSPVLREFQDVFTHPVAKGWAGEMAARINDYTTRRDIADANTAAGENFVADIDAFKSGLVSGVQNDPFFVHTALDLVEPTLRALTSGMPNVPEDVDAHHAALAGHIQSEIATAAVTMLAETHEGAARGMLADERIATLLGEAVPVLNGYIGAQAKARAIDHAAEADSLRAHAAVAADTKAADYLTSLVNPASNTVQFPAGFNQGVLADPALPPPIKAGVLAVYERLRASGDIERSNPYVVTDAIRRAANGEPPAAGELLQMAGTDLTLNDALALTRKLSLSPAANVEAKQMMVTLDAARRVLSPPEYGAAGQAAYGRFADWFLDNYQRLGPGSLNPKSDSYLLPSGDTWAAQTFWNNFAPRGDDFVLGARVPGTTTILEEDFIGQDSMSLDRPAGSRAAGDEVIQTPRPFLDTTPRRGRGVTNRDILRNPAQPDNPTKGPQTIGWSGTQRPSLASIFGGALDRGGQCPPRLSISWPRILRDRSRLIGNRCAVSGHRRGRWIKSGSAVMGGGRGNVAVRR